MSKIQFTKFLSISPLSKEYSLIDDTLIKKANVLSIGGAETIQCGFEDFYQHLINADAYTAFGYGISEHKSILITSKKSGLADGIQFITRSKENYHYPDGGGIIMLDHDPSDYCPYKLTVKKFLRILKKICPAFAGCAFIARRSVSAGVHREGQVNQAKGFHVYIPVINASDIPRFGKLLHDYMWQEGYGFIALSKDGKMYERSPIDALVFSPERLDFVGIPVVNSPLLYQNPQCIMRSGNDLDTSLLKPRHLNRNLRDENIKNAKKRMLLKQKEVQAEYDHVQFSKLLEQGYTAIEAQTIVARNRANNYQILDESHTLYFSNGMVCTIREAVEKKLFGESLADPVEGIEYGTTTAQLIKRHGQPFIRSFAHGGREYRVVSAKESSINFISANPGYGKTLALYYKLRELYKNREYICVVVPTTNLMDQYRRDLQNFGFGLNNIHSISSKENNISVCEQLNYAINDKEHLILITSACLKSIKKPMYKKMAHYNVFIDEVFYPMLSCETFTLNESIQKYGVLKKLCHWEPIDNVPDAYVLMPKQSKKRSIFSQLKKKDEKDSLDNAATNKVLEAVIDNSKQVIISKMNWSKNGNYCIAEMYNCMHLKHFKTCTIASAFVQETELYHWCSLHFNMVDVTNEYSAHFQDLSHRLKMLTVMPFVEHYTKHERDNTRFLKRHSFKEIKAQILVNRIIKHCSYFNDETLRILNNDDFVKCGQYELLANGHDIEGYRISSQVHGQNHLQHINSAIIVAAFNLYSYQTAFLNKLLPFYDPWLERNVLTTIQCFMRTSLRNKDATEHVFVMVPDKRTCEAVIKLYDNLPSMGSHCLFDEYEAI
jgi:hypothetical protein